jgi:hypothetical protein
MVRSFDDKQAYEEYYIAFNFFRLLAKGNDTIATATVSVLDALGVNKTDVLTTVGSQYIDETRVYVWVKGGTAQRYKITCKITTAGGKKWEMDGYLTVVDD